MPFARNHLDEFPQSEIFLFTVGRDDLLKESFIQAEKHFLALIKIAPNNISAQKLLAEVYLKTFQCEKVDVILDSILSRNPKDVKAWTLKGKKELIVGDIPAARRCIDKARCYDPDDRPELLLATAQVELAELKFDMVRSRIKFYLEEVDPDSTEAHLLEAQIALIDADYSLVRTSCKRILKKHKKHTGALITLGQAALAEMDFSEAEYCAKEAALLQPHNPAAQLLLAQIDLFQNIKNPAKIAITSDLKDLAKKYPKNTAILNALGYLCSIQQDFVTAEKHFNEVLILNAEDTTALGALAEIALRKGDVETAQKLAISACRINWKNLQGLYVQGRVALAKTPPDYTAALVPFKEITQYYPRLANVADQVNYLAKNAHQSSTPDFQMKKTQLLSLLQVKSFISPAFHLEVVAF